MTTTITPTHQHTTLTATLTSPLHHGAGTSGNTSLLRTMQVVQPDGTTARVPFVSANSVRHGLREALAWHVVNVLDVDHGSLSKAAVDLLWTGGAVTSTGARTNLELSRRIEDTLPSLAMLGYAAQSDIVAGTLRVQNLILACQESAHLLPTTVDTDRLRRAAAYRGSEFGTRHDVSASPVDRFISAASETAGGTQMIYDVQTINPGAVLAGGVSLTPAATRMHQVTMEAALALWAPGGETGLAAKTAVGYGSVHIEGIPDTADASLQEWTQHLQTHRGEVLDLIREVADG
ncbi:hypothetical protein [Nesterenkonia suensis]